MKLSIGKLISVVYFNWQIAGTICVFTDKSWINLSLKTMKGGDVETDVLVFWQIELNLWK